MSRIDQALRRLAAEKRGAPPSTDIAGDPDIGSVLDHYPEEDRSGVVAPVVVPHGRRDLEQTAVTNAAPPSDTVSQYRDLATALEQHKSTQQLKRLVVTSALRDDGRTFTVINLALMLSTGLGRRVLLLDADLERPAVHTTLRVPNASGLSEWLRLERDSSALLDISERLAVIPAGRADPAALAALASERMEDLIDQRADEFDWILVDAPPAVDVDPGMFASIGGGVLFVIRAGWTPYAQVQRAIKSLDAHRIIGTVLNGVTNAV